MKTIIIRCALAYLLLDPFRYTVAADRHWITGPGDGTLIDTHYGTATTPLNWFDNSKWFESDNTTSAMAPIDGQSVNHSRSCCNPEPFISIDNSGNGVNLPSSSIEFSAKTNLFDLSAGNLSDVANGSYNLSLVDDSLIADRIAFNGEGGSPVDVYVPITADSISSNRHGARFHAPISVNNIIANSRHQDRWEINVSPTKRITLIELDENRGADGGNTNGFFEVNADTQVFKLEHVWQTLRVGLGATLEVDSVLYFDYTDQVTNNNINPVRLDGNMIANRFEIHNVSTGESSLLSPGTYGRIGHPSADKQVDWIVSGDGVLTIPVPVVCYAINSSTDKTVTFCL